MGTQNNRPTRFKNGVFIPLSLWLNEELSVIEKIIIVEVQQNRGSIKNEYLSLICQMSESNVTKTISSLVSRGFIQSSGHADQRIIKLHASFIKSISAQNAFDGVFIQLSLWNTPLITPVLKFLLVEIAQLDDGDGCRANNEYFSKLLNISESQVSRLISQLSKLKLIETKTIKAGRKTYLNADLEHFFNSDIEPLLHIEKAEIRKNNAVTINDLVDTLFSEFWEQYPNKNRGEIKPKQTYCQIVKSGIAHEHVMQKLNCCLSSKHWLSGRVPLATAWLSREFL